MTSQSLTRIAVQGLPRVNLLPPEVHEARRLRQVKLASGGGVVIAAVAVAGLTVMAAGQVSSAQDGLSAAQAQNASLQKQYNGLQNVRQTEAQLQARQAMLTQAMGQEIQWSHYLNDLSLAMPDHVWLTQLSFQENIASGPSGAVSQPSTDVLPTGIGKATFSGIANSYDDVATWLETLAKEKGYVAAYATNLTAAKIGDTPTVNFSSSVALTNDTLSQRYTKPLGE